MIALVVILAIISVITWIWMIVVAFKESVLWGIGMIFLPFPLAIVFAALHWQEAKKPFLAYIISNLLFTVLWFKLFYNVFSESMEVAMQQESGEISEAEAQRRMFEMFGMDVPPELQQEAPVEQTTESEITRLTEQLEQGGQNEPATLPEPEPVHVFNQITLAQAKNHVGKEIQITTVNGVVKRGKLKEVRYDRIVMTRSYRGGDFTFEVLNRTIDRIEVLELLEN